jgi:hypothetical protein
MIPARWRLAHLKCWRSSCRYVLIAIQLMRFKTMDGQGDVLFTKPSRVLNCGVYALKDISTP